MPAEPSQGNIESSVRCRLNHLSEKEMSWGEDSFIKGRIIVQKILENFEPDTWEGCVLI